MISVKKKQLFCLFLLDVLCSFRKYEKFGVMDRCLECPHYKKFLREMDKQDEMFWDEEARVRKYGYP